VPDIESLMELLDEFQPGGKKEETRVRPVSTEDRSTSSSEIQTEPASPSQERKEAQNLKAQQLSGSLPKWNKRLKAAKAKYEKETGWDSSALQADVAALEALQTEVNEALDGIKRTSLAEDEQREFDKVKRFNRRLVRLCSALQQKYVECSSQIGIRLRAEKDAMEAKLRSRTGVEEVVLHLYQQVEMAKYQLFHETKRRCELEVLLEREIMELNRSLILESTARREIRLQIEQALRVKSSVVGELELLRDSMQLMIDQMDQERERETEEALEKGKIPSRTSDVLSLIDMTKTIDK
jgi:hypothetical protein